MTDWADYLTSQPTTLVMPNRFQTITFWAGPNKPIKCTFRVANVYDEISSFMLARYSLAVHQQWDHGASPRRRRLTLLLACARRERFALQSRVIGSPGFTILTNKPPTQRFIYGVADGGTRYEFLSSVVHGGVTGGGLQGRAAREIPTMVGSSANWSRFSCLILSPVSLLISLVLFFLDLLLLVVVSTVFFLFCGLAIVIVDGVDNKGDGRWERRNEGGKHQSFFSVPRLPPRTPNSNYSGDVLKHTIKHMAYEVTSTSHTLGVWSIQKPISCCL